MNILIVILVLFLVWVMYGVYQWHKQIEIFEKLYDTSLENLKYFHKLQTEQMVKEAKKLLKKMEERECLK